MVVLDTNVVSAVMHRSPEALHHLARHRPDEVVLCSPVAAEIQYGLARLTPRSRRRRTLDAEYRRLRAVLRWADWTEASAEVFGQQKARLERLGTRLDDMDLVIGSVALSLDASIATRNVRHLERIQGLAIADWSTPS